MKLLIIVNDVAHSFNSCLTDRDQNGIETESLEIMRHIRRTSCLTDRDQNGIETSKKDFAAAMQGLLFNRPGSERD